MRDKGTLEEFLSRASGLKVTARVDVSTKKDSFSVLVHKGKIYRQSGTKAGRIIGSDVLCEEGRIVYRLSCEEE